MKIKIKKFLPKQILPRLLIIFFVPLILTQILAIYFFYGKHWEKVTTRFSNIAGNKISLLIQTYKLEGEYVTKKLARDLNIILEIEEKEDFKIKDIVEIDFIKKKIFKTLKNRLNKDLRLEIQEDVINIFVLYEKGKIFKITYPKKYLISETPTIFFLWIIMSAVILSVLAFLFLRIQVRAITRLSEFSSTYGIDKKFKSEGATEIRMAGNSVIKMKRKIKNELDNRTKFLAGISHDLGTLITRIKLQLELVKKPSDVRQIDADINSIQSILNEYLEFSKNVFYNEKKKKINIFNFLEKLISEISKQYCNKKITLVCDKNINFFLLENNFLRVCNNLFNNACQFSDKIDISVTETKKFLEVQVDDNGPGIPKKYRDHIFKPFFKKDKARNLKYPGSGLGLSIVSEILKKVGGKIIVKSSKKGGASFITTWPKIN